MHEANNENGPGWEAEMNMNAGRLRRGGRMRDNELGAREPG